MSMAISVDQLGQTDLSILVYFVVLVEEKTVANAARRLKLTQPALTRALQRLRETFRDELLVRTDAGYQPTPKGQELLAQLSDILPKIDDIMSGTTFDPSKAQTNFNITAADSLCFFYAPLLAKEYKSRPNISFTFSSYGDERFADLETNTQDLVLDAQYKSLGEEFRTEVLLNEELVCVVAKSSIHRHALTLDEYMAARHITITTLHDIQAIPDLAFARDGLKRKSPFRVPYFSTGLSLIENSPLIVTLPRSLAVMLVNTKITRIVKAPKEVGSFQYIMVWHKRQEHDERHRWLRKTLRSASDEFLTLIAKKERSLSRSLKRTAAINSSIEASAP